jgi:Ni2+-binding GTPase involved in maturation of urease and hydrogenase
MTRLVFLGGFLGSGKTTSLLRLARQLVASDKRVGILTNDQGDDLVDTELFRASGFATRDVRGGCFCCRLDDFMEQAATLTSTTKPDVLLAEPVGSCTDLAATVVRPLQYLYGGAFTIAPLTVLIDPARAHDVLSTSGNAKLSDKITYIYRLQQMEADAIAINKIDTLKADERAHTIDLVRAQFPVPRTLCISALTGEGFDDLAAWLLGNAPSAARASPAIDYGLYAEGEAELAWFDGRFGVTARKPVELDATLMQLAALLRERLADGGLPIAHVKLLAAAGQYVAAVNVPRSGMEPELARPSNANATLFHLLINARVSAPPAQLRRIVEESVRCWSNEADAVATRNSAAAFSPIPPLPTHRIA